jgi:hypothetical protein
MLTIAVVLASLIAASTAPAKAPTLLPRVAVGDGIRIALPVLGQTGATDKQRPQQVFTFYVGLFDG